LMMMPTAMSHENAIETLAIERYLLGEMAEEERDAFEEHFFSCPECADDARAARAMRDGVAAGIVSRAATTPGRVLEMPAARRRIASTIVPWAAAASLALVAGYQAFVVQPALRRSAGPTVLSPVTLRPASRGEEPVVLASGALVTLAVDLGGAIDGEIAYEIRQASGATIASDRAPAPKDGAPLLLLVPAALLPPGQHYVLVVKNSGNAGLTPADYRFTVGAR
jgi:anti-sigma factor RsiW